MLYIVTQSNISPCDKSLGQLPGTSVRGLQLTRIPHYKPNTPLQYWQLLMNFGSSISSMCSSAVRTSRTHLHLFSVTRKVFPSFSLYIRITKLHIYSLKSNHRVVWIGRDLKDHLDQVAQSPI